MNTRIFLFNENPDITAERGIKALESIFADYLQDDESIGIYPSVKDAINIISKALKDSHVIIFLATLDKYAEIKKKLARSFSLDMQINEELQNKAFTTLNTILTNSSAEEYAHCIVPVNSRVFALEDGLYSGFSAISGNQTIICLPWEKERTEVLLTKQVIPYINSAYNVSIDDKGYSKFYCKQLSEVVNSDEPLVAIPKTNTSSYFLDYVNNCPELNDAIKNTDRTEKRGNLAPDKYIQNLSVMAKELASTKYGIAISNAYYTGTDENSEKVVYLAVTNENQSLVRKVTSFPGENVEDFLERSCGDLCSFICDFIEEETVSAALTEEADIKSKKEKKYKIGIVIVSIINILLIVGTVLILLFHNKLNSSFYTPVIDEETEITTLAEETTTIKEKEATTEASETSETSETDESTYSDESTSSEETSTTGETTQSFVVAG